MSLEQTPTPTSDPIVSPLSGGADRADPSVASPSSPPETVTPAAARPEGLPDDLWDAAAGVKFGDVVERLKERDTLKSEADARKAGVPDKPDAYELKLPDDVKLPDGMALNPNDPRIAPLRELAHQQGWNQQQFSALVAMDVAQKQAEAAAMSGHVQAQKDALGANAGPRVDAVTTWLASTADDKTARQVASMMVTADIVKWFETAQRALSSQGVDAFRQGGREPADDGKNIPGYATMTFEQKRAAYNAKQAGASR